MTLLKLKSSFSYHFLAALLIAIWLSAFLILIAPFDVAELSIKSRLETMPFYGLISFMGYTILIPFQKWVYKNTNKQSIYFEILILILFSILVLIGSYTYYKSSIVNGDYSFTKFTFGVFSPILSILLPIIIFARWFINRKVLNRDSDKIILSGDNKLDFLQIREKDLICISSADNYVTIGYLINGVLTRKLLRTTLKSIESQLPKLIKVHRSHLINPIHFKEWKNANTLLLTQTEVPISKNYKKVILKDYSFIPKNE